MSDEQKVRAYRTQYTDVILEACGADCSELDACEVQQIMYTHLAQTQHIYALDRYSRAELAEMARESYEALKIIREDEPNFTLLF